MWSLSHPCFVYTRLKAVCVPRIVLDIVIKRKFWGPQLTASHVFDQATMVISNHLHVIYTGKELMKLYLPLLLVLPWQEASHRWWLENYQKLVNQLEMALFLMKGHQTLCYHYAVEVIVFHNLGWTYCFTAVPKSLKERSINESH